MKHEQQIVINRWVPILEEYEFLGSPSGCFPRQSFRLSFISFTIPLTV